MISFVRVLKKIKIHHRFITSCSNGGATMEGEEVCGETGLGEGQARLTRESSTLQAPAARRPACSSDAAANISTWHRNGQPQAPNGGSRTILAIPNTDWNAVAGINGNHHLTIVPLDADENGGSVKEKLANGNGTHLLSAPNGNVIHRSAAFEESVSAYV